MTLIPFFLSQVNVAEYKIDLTAEGVFYNDEKLDLPMSMGKLVVTKIGTYTIVNGIEGMFYTNIIYF